MQPCSARNLQQTGATFSLAVFTCTAWVTKKEVRIRDRYRSRLAVRPCGFDLPSDADADGFDSRWTSGHSVTGCVIRASVFFSPTGRYILRTANHDNGSSILSHETSLAGRRVC